MDAAELPRQQISLRRLLVIVSLWSILFAICTWGGRVLTLNGIWWGPIYFIHDGSRENQFGGWVLACLSAALVMPVCFRLTPISLLLAGCGVAWWLASGLLGLGINV